MTADQIPAGWAELARKAAMADELLEALKTLVDTAANLATEDESDTSYPINNALRAARAALAKAKGGQS